MQPLSYFNITATIAIDQDLDDSDVLGRVTDDLLDAVAGYSGVVAGAQHPFSDGHLEVTISIAAETLLEAIERAIRLLEDEGLVVAVDALPTVEFDARHDFVNV